MPGEEGDTELGVHPESPRPCPPLPCVLSSTVWNGCCAGNCLCSWAKAQALNWLHSHGGTASPAFPGLPLLSSSTSICGHATVGTATSGCGICTVCPCSGHCWPAPAPPQSLQSLAAALPHCSSPSLSSGVMGQVFPGDSTLELFLHSAPTATWVGSGDWRSDMFCPLSIPGLLPSGQHLLSNHEKVSLRGEELAATSLGSACCNLVVAMGSSRWALIVGGLKALLPPLPGLPTPLSAAERVPGDVLLVTVTGCEHPAVITLPWLAPVLHLRQWG